MNLFMEASIYASGKSRSRTTSRVAALYLWMQQFMDAHLPDPRRSLEEKGVAGSLDVEGCLLLREAALKHLFRV
jgi:hypothetical protein